MVTSLSNTPQALAAADFNGDQKLDLAISVTNTGTVVLLSNGNGTFQSPLVLPLPANSPVLAVGSLVKGGPPGIILNDGATISLYYGNGAGSFSGPYSIGTPAVGGGMAIGDVNGDGIPDIVSAGVYIFFGAGGGKFTKPYYNPIAGSAGPIGAHGIALADLRNNGLTDIVTEGNGVSVLLAEGKGAFVEGIWTNVSGGASCGVRGDFNRDGRPDLAVNNANGIAILLGTGKYVTPFTAGTSIAQPGAGCLVTADVNGDGKLDLLVPVNGTVVTYLGNGDGTFALTSTTPTPSGGSLALGDFNRDGKVDFVTSGNLIVYGNGDGTFQNPATLIADPP